MHTFCILVLHCNQSICFDANFTTGDEYDKKKVFKLHFSKISLHPSFEELAGKEQILPIIIDFFSQCFLLRFLTTGIQLSSC